MYDVAKTNITRDTTLTRVCTNGSFQFLIVKSKYIETPSVPKEKGKRPGFGCGSVKITMTKDFDAPLEDFKDYM